MSYVKPKFFLVVRCEDKQQGVRFCVITDKAVFFDSRNPTLEEGSHIEFQYPEEDENFLTDAERRSKRGRSKKVLKKKVFFGLVMKKCSDQHAAFEEMNNAVKRSENPALNPSF